MRVSDSLLARLRFLLYAVALLIWIAFPPLVNASNTTPNQAFGFNLYGPSGLSFAGQVTVTNGSSATAQHTLVNGAAMSVLVQVYNYTNGGSHHFFNLSYPGGDSALSVTMNVTPVYSGAGQAVGFHLYRQIPNKATQLVATGSITAQDSNSQTVSATVSARSAAVYQLEVYNYWPDTQVSYGITVTGLAGPEASAGTNLDDRHAIVLNSARPSATGTIVGNRGGAYNYYLVTYPGNNF